MDEEDELSPSELPENLETFDVETETGITDRVPYNKELTNRACSGRTREYWPEVVAVRTSLRYVSTPTTSCQYSPVRPSRSVSKRLLSI